MTMQSDFDARVLSEKVGPSLPAQSVVDEFRAMVAEKGRSGILAEATIFTGKEILDLCDFVDSANGELNED